MMAGYSKVSLLSLCCLICFSLCGEEAKTSACAEEVEPKTVRPMRIVTRHIDPGGIGYNEGYTTLEGFFSPIRPYGDAWVPFVDLRGHLFNNGNPAANAGTGMRYIAGSRVWGVNAYYDYRKTNRQHYNQVAAGLESLGKVWDFRVNGYLPVGKKTSSLWGTRFDHFQGHYAILSGKKEFALKGVNGEAAAHINVAKNVDLTVAMGPYYLVGHGDTAWGGESRVELDLFKYCKLEGFTSYDTTFRWTGQGQFSIVIPFGHKRKIHKKAGQSCSTAAALAARSVQTINRFEIIPVDRKRTKAKAIDPSTDKPYFFWFVNNTSHSKGTFESPFPTLIAAQNASAPGDVIYVFPGDGTSAGMDKGIALKNNQRLFGAGIGYILPTTTGSMSIPPQASGLPMLTASLGSSVVTVANHNSISGLQITTDANGTINGSYCIGSLSGMTKDLFVSRNIITANNGAVGILPNVPYGEIAIANNTVQSTDDKGAYGIYLSQKFGTGSYTVENNFISHFQNLTILPPDVPSGTAIAILAQDQSRVDAVVSGNQISDCVGYVIDLHAFGIGTPVLNAVVTGNRMEGLALHGAGTFIFSDDSAIITFNYSDNRINEFPFGIIAQAEGNSIMTGTIKNNVLSNGPLGSGIILDTNFIDQSGSAKGFFEVISNDISRYGDAQGVATSANGTSSLTAFIEKNYIHEIGKAGLFLQGFGSSNTKLVVLDNTIDGNNGGMEVDALENSNLHLVMQRNIVTNNNGAGLFGEPILTNIGHASYGIFGNTFMNNNLMNLNSGSAVTIIPDASSNVCLSMQNNQSTQEATLPDYYFHNMGTGQFSVEPFVNNTGSLDLSGITYVPAGTCGP
ncbi:MAG: inverse autotransporter beta domain-containing protein [Verrucomicrobia bacterium]|nr:inverse autotransporter beta domain-containing protein [Verrucomicrobiota bacterium]